MPGGEWSDAENEFYMEWTFPKFWPEYRIPNRDEMTAALKNEKEVYINTGKTELTGLYKTAVNMINKT